ncbi:MAG: hypothetical protein GF317_12850 [Candidatus Lokiarchaeota archaeon]|nr:hypothetical protein [Candidatus Lokiarchaeota archaeon]MBD3200530.1 hypothetical protein [Candidatus Lokiarchaeota archaeon]
MEIDNQLAIIDKQSVITRFIGIFLLIGGVLLIINAFWVLISNQSSTFGAIVVFSILTNVFGIFFLLLKPYFLIDKSDDSMKKLLKLFGFIEWERKIWALSDIKDLKSKIIEELHSDDKGDITREDVLWLILTLKNGKNEKIIKIKPNEKNEKKLEQIISFIQI